MKDIERFGDLLFAVSLSESMEILNWKRDVFSYTPLEYASIRGHAELITTILSSLPQSKRLGLLLGDGYTPLHFAATRGDTECVKAILTPLTSKQQLKLIEKVHEGLTASDGAAIYQKADIVCLLHFFQLKAELQISSEESGELLDKLLYSSILTCFERLIFSLFSFWFHNIFSALYTVTR